MGPQASSLVDLTCTTMSAAALDAGLYIMHAEHSTSGDAILAMCMSVAYTFCHCLVLSAACVHTLNTEHVVPPTIRGCKRDDVKLPLRGG